MGLLDEAIREHLDLKRRRGADPGEIARAEQEALEPIFPDEPSGDFEEEPAGSYEQHETGAESASAESEASEQGSQPAQSPDFSNVGQETAELDMQAFLDADLEHHPEAPEQVPGQERMSFE